MPPTGRPLILRSDRLAGVFDHRQPVFPRDLEDRIEIGGMPERVDDDNGARPRSNAPLQLAGIQV